MKGPWTRSVAGMRPPTRSRVRPPCGPRCPPRPPTVVFGAWAGGRCRRAGPAPRHPLSLLTSDAGAACRLSGPVPRDSAPLAPAGWRGACRARRERAGGRLPGRPGRPGCASPGPRAGGSPASAPAARPLEPAARCAARPGAGRADLPRAIAPRPCDLERRRVQAPPPPHRALPPGARGVPRGTVRDTPAWEGRGVARPPACRQAGFDRAGTQRIRQRPAPTPAEAILGELGPFEPDRPGLAPP
jgi:hypothetical protein